MKWTCAVLAVLAFTRTDGAYVQGLTHCVLYGLL